MFHRILIPLDGSQLAEQALALAATVAGRAGGGTSLVELLVVHSPVGRASEAFANETVSERIYVTGLAEEAGRLLGLNVIGTVVEGAPGPAIVRRANETSADLIVMTTHGRTGLSRALLGSVADEVVRESGRPVLLHRPMPGRRWRTAVNAAFRRILVPLDGTEESATVLTPVLDLCDSMGARPTLARVVLPIYDLFYNDAGMPPGGVVNEEATRAAVVTAANALQRLASNIEADRRMPSQTSVTVGDDAGMSLVEVALRGSFDLIALTTHGRGASRLFVGSVADRLLRESGLPMLLLHPHPAQASGVESEMHAFA